MPDQDDVARLREILDVAAEHRLMLGVVKVGDISIQVTGRLPIETPRQLGPEDGRVPIDQKDVEREKWLVEARRRSKATFGYVKSDEVLLAMEGAV